MTDVGGQYKPDSIDTYEVSNDQHVVDTPRYLAISWLQTDPDWENMTLIAVITRSIMQNIHGIEQINLIVDRSFIFKN